jgi:hypothetical protein
MNVAPLPKKNSEFLSRPLDEEWNQADKSHQKVLRAKTLSEFDTDLVIQSTPAFIRV